jgi:hypothetical protein
MAISFIRPGDVPPHEARRILAFLNAVSTEEEIDHAVEIAHERDVGVRIGRRILQRRHQLGLFTSLQQIDDIPHIGPERFHEIVITLRERVPPPPPAEAYEGDVATALADLRARVEALLPAHRLTLRAATAGAYLGQPSTLIATALDPVSGNPKPGVPITFVASWGRLRSTNRLDFPQGGTLTVPAGVDGTARVVLLPPTSEDLFDDQQDALVTMLQRLPADALTPAQAQAGLREMAGQYRWEPAHAFRTAVDVYLRDFRPHLLDTINLRDYSLEWATIESTIIAYAQDDVSANGAIHGSALLRLRFKDWLAAWLEMHLAVASEADKALRTELDVLVKRPWVGADGVVDDVQARVQAYVAGQRGLAGTYIGRKVAESSLRAVLDTTVAKLPIATRIRVLPTLDVASKTLATQAGGAGVLEAVSRTRQDAKRTTDTTATELTSRIRAVDTALDTKLASTTFSSFRSTVEATFASKADTTTLDDLRGSVEGQLADKVDAAALERKLDVAVFTPFHQEIQASLEGKADRGALNEVQRVLEEELGSKVSFAAVDDLLNRLRANLQSQLEGKADTAALTGLSDFVRSVERRLDLKVDRAVFEDMRETVEKRLQNKVELNAFDEFQFLVSSTFNTKVDNREFEERIKRIEAEIEDLRRRLR